MALGKQHTLIMVPEKEDSECRGCWFESQPYNNCPKNVYNSLYCDIEDKSVWVLKPVTPTETFRNSDYPYPGDVNTLLMRLVNDVNTRPEIRNEIRNLWKQIQETQSHQIAWNCTVELHKLCWKYC